MERRNKIILSALAGGLIYTGVGKAIIWQESSVHADAGSTTEQVSTNPSDQSDIPFSHNTLLIALGTVGILCGGCIASVLDEKGRPQVTVVSEQSSNQQFA